MPVQAQSNLSEHRNPQQEKTDTVDPGLAGSSGVHDGQAPAPPGKLTGDRDGADGGPLAAGVQAAPALVEPLVATLGPLSDRGRAGRPGGQAAPGWAGRACGDARPPRPAAG